MFQFAWQDDKGVLQGIYVDFWRTGESEVTMEITRGNYFGRNNVQWKEQSKRNLSANEYVTDLLPKGQRENFRTAIQDFLTMAVGISAPLGMPLPTNEETDVETCYECGLPETENTGGLNTYEGEHQTVGLCDECHRQRITDDEEAEREEA